MPVQACSLLNIPGDTEIWHLTHQYLQNCSGAAEGRGFPSAGRDLRAQSISSLPAAPRTQLIPWSSFLPGHVSACCSQDPFHHHCWVIVPITNGSSTISFPMLLKHCLHGPAKSPSSLPVSQNPEQLDRQGQKCGNYGLQQHSAFLLRTAMSLALP